MKSHHITLLLAALLVACQVEQEPVRSIGMGHVRSVTTTFTSHQHDTQQKHDQVVSVAEFNPDGSLIRMTNHLTYPYDYAEPEIADFWSDPNADALVHLMDGLEMGGKWNFIYGNKWPAKYAEVIEDRGHPKYEGYNDTNYRRFNSEVIARNQGFPTTISTEATYEEDPRIISLFNGYEERFEYEGGKVKVFETKTLINPEFFNTVEKEGSKISIKQPTSRTNSEYFEYVGDQLTSFRMGDVEHKYFYEGDLLTRSEFHLRGKMRNHRVHYYSEQGLKEKTEIFNTNGEAEYTIEYHYDFYEES